MEDDGLNPDARSCSMFKDESDKDATWNIMIRTGGSVCLYATSPHWAAHGVAWDSLDNLPVNSTVQPVIDKISEMAEYINALLTAVKAQK